jgi:hypothetical protein
MPKRGHDALGASLRHLVLPTWKSWTLTVVTRAESICNPLAYLFQLRGVVIGGRPIDGSEQAD